MRTDHQLPSSARDWGNSRLLQPTERASLTHLFRYTLSQITVLLALLSVGGNYTQIKDTEEMAQLIIYEAMESGSLQQRNVVGVITGLRPPSCATSLVSHLLTSTPALVLQSSPFEACSTTSCIFQPGLGSGCLTRIFVSSLPLSLGLE